MILAIAAVGVAALLAVLPAFGAGTGTPIAVGAGVLAVGFTAWSVTSGATPPLVIAVLLVYGALMATLGILLGSLARTEGQAAGIGVVSANVLAALGGCWWPIEVTPGWMQKLQLFLPTGWAMDALHKLISFAGDPVSVMPHLIGMLVLTCILVVMSVKVFRYQ